MKLLLDLQGLQSASRERGIGRLTRQLAHAIIAEGRHDIHVLLGEDLPDVIDAVETEFKRLLPPGRVHSFGPYGPTACVDPANAWRSRSAALLREARIAEIAPDIVHVSSLFEGYGEDFITSVGRLGGAFATAVTLYDLIPLTDPARYLDLPAYRAHYLRNVQDLKRADLLLSISEYSKREAIELLHLSQDRIAVIFAGVGDHFRPKSLTEVEAEALRRRYGIRRRFILHVGAADPRKNLELLVHAYTKLREGLREELDLVFAGTLNVVEQERLAAAAATYGVPPERMVLTGYIGDDDLIALYGLCDLLAFPSTHEGFGLPPLEAMACGAPVLAAGNTSVPEVIGRDDCLFDPFDVESLRERLTFALDNPDWRKAMRAYGPRRAKTFTWRAAARRTLDAFDALHARRAGERQGDGGSKTSPVFVRRARTALQAAARRALVALGPGQPPREGRDGGESAAALPVRRPRMAFVSPLPPDHSGVADYSAELLRELLDHYEIDLVHPDGATDDARLLSNCPVRDLGYFEQHAEGYDRILYSIGNSTFHSHMFGLLALFPGTVILHDAFLSDLAVYLLHTSDMAPIGVIEEIYTSHGVTGLRLLAREGYDAVVRSLSMSGGVFRDAQGVIVHSDYAVALAEEVFGPTVRSAMAVVPLLRSPPRTVARDAARAALAIGEDEFVVTSFGIVHPRKQSLEVAQAYAASGLAAEAGCRLVFVGGCSMALEAYAAEVLNAVRKDHPGAAVAMTGRVSEADYRRYMEATDIAVQLRTESRGETSAATLDTMAYGLPTLATDLGAARELPSHLLVKIETSADVQTIGAELRRLYRDAPTRRRLGEAARAHVIAAHHPGVIGRRVRDLVEGFAVRSGRVRERALIEAVATIAPDAEPAVDDCQRLAGHLRALYPTPRHRQMFCDVTILAHEDTRTGIQRVVRTVLDQLITEPPDGFRVEPVVLRDGSPHYARAFLRDRLGLSIGTLDDVPVEFEAGDHFLGLDWVPDRLPDFARWFGRFRRSGGVTTFVVYDLLPLEAPQYFPDWMEAIEQRWLDTLLTYADRLACISAATADSVVRFGDPAVLAKRLRPLEIGWFHLGHDLAAGMPTGGLPEDAAAVVEEMGGRTTFLMVGTVEPRKGHADVLDAFDALWAENRDVALVIVGKEGWMVQALTDRIRGHPEFGRRLLWLPKVSDEYLERLYPAAAALIVASHGEGFGLPLIEGAARGTPVIARDLPVFREVGSNHAAYFDGRAKDGLAAALRSWLVDRAQGRVPSSTPMARLNWADATAQMLAVIRGERVYRRLGPDGATVPGARASGARS